MIRRTIAIGLGLAVLIAALCAPLVHAHPDDHDTDHHPARAIHAHYPDHDSHATSSAAPVLDDSDHDRAVFLHLFVAVAAPSIDVPATTAAVFELVAPMEMAAHPWVDAVYGHDPPTACTLASRAPPAFLS